MVGSRALPAVLVRVPTVDCPDAWRLQLRALATLSVSPPHAGRQGGTEGRLPTATALGRLLAGAAAAGAAAILGLTATVPGGPFSVDADARVPAAAQGQPDAGEQAAVLQLHTWLTSQGADVSKVQVKPSQAGPGAGLGLFATAAAASPRPSAPWWSWLWPRRGAPAAGLQREPTTLAAFPLAAAITAQTACRDPQLGEQFSWMLDKQLLDERTAVMVYLLVQRLQGDRSKYAPWIRCLPRTFDVPIAYSEEELAALRGTTLYRATAAVVRRMRETWSRLEAPLGAVARDLGLQAPRFEDWVWAYCVFWSRGQSLPVPESGSASSALVGHSSNGSSEKIPIQILEGVVPGLDFCNHRHVPPPQCWWEVVAPDRPTAAVAEAGIPSTSTSRRASGPAAAAAAVDGPVVRLQLHAGASVRPGDELYISYGDKSNEELLMLYGFALPENPHDHLMMLCPLPPQAEWDDVMHARMELLQAYGLRPQFFLPHPDQVPVPEAAVPTRRKGKKAVPASKAASKPSAAAASPAPASAGEAAAGNDGDDAAADDVPPLVLPSEVLDTLEVFVLNFQELTLRSKALQAKMEERRASRAAGLQLAALSQHSPVLELASLRGRLPQMTTAELRHYLQSLGLRMATLTTFIRLLEVKVIELEGAEGTGSLEADQQLLATLDEPPSTSQQQQQQQERRLRGAVVYRMGQKQLARTWLVRAKGELRNLLALMRDMQARVEAVERGQQQR